MTGKRDETKFMKIIRAFATATLLALAVACQPSHPDAVQHIRHTDDGVLDAALADNGQISVTSTLRHGVIVWDNQAQQLKYRWYLSENEQNLVTHIALSPDNSMAVIADKTRFALFSLITGENNGFFEVNASSIRDIALSNQGTSVLYGRKDGTVVHVNLQTGRRIEFLGHQESINAVALSANGRYALSGANDYSAYLWDTNTGQVVYRFNHSSRVTQVAFDAQGRYAFTAGSMDKAKIWNLNTGALLSQLQYIERQKIFSAVRFSDDGLTLATGSPSRKVELWQTKTGTPLTSFHVEPKQGSRPKAAVVLAVAFAQNGQLMTQSSNGLLEYFEIEEK